MSIEKIFRKIPHGTYLGDSLGWKNYRFLKQHYQKLMPAPLHFHPSVCGFCTLFTAFHFIKFRQEKVTGAQDFTLQQLQCIYAVSTVFLLKFIHKKLFFFKVLSNLFTWHRNIAIPAYNYPQAYRITWTHKKIRRSSRRFAVVIKKAPVNPKFVLITSAQVQMPVTELVFAPPQTSSLFPTVQKVTSFKCFHSATLLHYVYLDVPYHCRNTHALHICWFVDLIS